MNTHIGTYALDDLLAATSNDIIQNGFNNTNFPPLIKGWLAEKVLSILPQDLLSEILKLIVEDRDLNECLSYVHDRDRKEIKIRFIPDFGALDDHENSNFIDIEELVFKKNETSCDFFDTTVIPETPFSERVAKTEKFIKHEEIEARSTKSPSKRRFGIPEYDDSATLPKYNKPTENSSIPNLTLPLQFMKPTMLYHSSDSSDSDGVVNCKHCDNVSYPRETNTRNEIKRKLHRHIRKQHPDKWAEKTERSKVSTKPNIRASSRIVDPENTKSYYLNKFACDFCDGFFSSRSGLTHHLKKWHAERLGNGIHYKFKCAPCQQKFDTQVELETHQAVEHPEYWKEKEKVMREKFSDRICPICDKIQCV